MLLASADTVWKYAAMAVVLWLSWYGWRFIRIKGNDWRDDRRNTRARPVGPQRYRRLWVIDREDEDGPSTQD